ncbi:SufE family protein [Halotalea alkalilenta]|uniref:Fe-S cluster assembly protein SufE n=1 Tax=Halotalea alkalilenta TaxID=376489 RepID=A0A172YFQ9_9GAMM|nr:SufE family protein [Halotalea alkalilenta]ANF58109.1 Fe-S cluster assembly protein SufE [Halotalea alkalilenta]
MSTEQAKAELIEEFGFFDNWMDRYQYIIDLGRELPPLPDEWKVAQYRIEGCQSNVWIHHQREGDVLHFDATSDAAIVAGLIAVVMRIYNDRSAEEILATPPDAFKQLGLEQHLSPTRNNGLHAMLAHIYQVAEREARG